MTTNIKQRVSNSQIDEQEIIPGLEEALLDVKEGKVTSWNNLEEMFSALKDDSDIDY